MVRVLVDTTVLVSAFLNPAGSGVAFNILKQAADRTFELLISDFILEEVASVLLRPGRKRGRFGYDDLEVPAFCQGIRRLATIVVDLPAERIVRDPNDDRILAAAVHGNADYLVSRDQDLLVLGLHGAITIITPEALLERLRRGSA